MDFEFHSQEELLQRVYPALRTKISEFHKLGYDLKEIELWDFLSNEKWKSGKDLTLYDIVNDILSCEGEEVVSYIQKKSLDA